MADPLSVTAGLLAVVGTAFQSVKLLRDAVASFQSNQRRVRELREELEALDGVLESLQVTIAGTDADLSMLELPLLRCGNACKDFEAVIAKCTAHSGGPRTSFRDWAKLQYMGDDIVGFKNTLAGYKSTIMIALAGANMRTSAITISVLNDYKRLIAETISDLKEHLQDIDNKLKTSSSQGTRVAEVDTIERQQIQEERDSTQRCLDVCAQVYKYIDQAQPSGTATLGTSLLDYSVTVGKLGGLPPSKLVTVESFKTCKETLAQAITILERNLQDLNGRLQSFSSQPPKGANGQGAEEERIQVQIDTMKQCLVICNQAAVQADQNRTNVFEDVSLTDDGGQVIVSTIGDLISAKRITAGARSVQFMGQMSDDSLQRLSRDHAHKSTEKEPEIHVRSQFQDRYGGGVKLSSRRGNDEAKVHN